MDTVTQALLGGAIGFTVCKQSRRAGMLWGAGFAIVPDLDMFIPYDTDLDSITHHRSWSHSWLVQTAVSPILAYLCHKWNQSFNYQLWLKLIWLALVTHSALDALTVYGTQLFWPFMPSPVSGGSVFIIDPVYSLPLLAGFVLMLIKPHSLLGRRFLSVSFLFSCLYLGWGFAAQQWVFHQIEAQRSEQQLARGKIKVIATPFNTLLWRVVITNADHYYEAYVSVFDNNNKIQLQQYDRGTLTYQDLLSFSSTQRLAWFTNDFYKLEKYQDRIIATDLRIGVEPDYLFRFDIARKQGEKWLPLPANRVNTSRNIKAVLHMLWQRIWQSPVN